MPGLGGKFTISVHNGFIDERGEPVIHEIMLICPCSGVDDAARLTGHPDLSCTKCDGVGYFHRKPKQLVGLVTAVIQDYNESDYSVKLYPGDCVFSPKIDERRIGQYDKITFTRPQPLTEGQIITRGATNHSDMALSSRMGLEPNEDRLWYEAVSSIHVESMDDNREYVEGSDFELEGKVIRWYDGVMPDRTRYVIKYNGYLEWIALAPPMERRDHGADLGQKVLLRKVHVFRSSSKDASEESAGKRLGGVGFT